MIAELGKQTQEFSVRLDALQESLRPDPTESFMRKISFGLLIAVLAIQLLEGVSIMACSASMGSMSDGSAAYAPKDTTSSSVIVVSVFG